jgi:hypothetical protein
MAILHLRKRFRSSRSSPDIVRPFMPSTPRPALLAACYAIAIFAGAFLVFQVQPVIGRAILPWYGGSPAVWTTCMLFFQTVLLLGYLYAHLLTLIPSVRVQAIIHLVVTVAAFISLPILPDASWKPTGGGDPTWPILMLLGFHVGLPYLLLSSTGPLMQAWFSRSLPGRSPYRLYALSNVGSLLALLTYPVLVEPTMTVREQTVAWGAGFGFFAIVAALLSGRWWLPAAETSEGASHAAIAGTANGTGLVEKPSWTRRLSWLLLPALASVVLLATTNHVCQDVAVIPFLWVAPLALYLFSFILCFDSPRWYGRVYWGVIAIVSIVAVSAMKKYGATDVLLIEIGVYFTALLSISMICHGELVRRKPHAKYLTEFYLMCSAGGALGGLLVAIVSPLVFSTFVELNLALIFACAISAIAVFQDERLKLRSRSVWIYVTGGIVLLIAFIAVFWMQTDTMQTHRDLAVRNFYGVLYIDHVIDSENPEESGTKLVHGRISHGFQYSDPELRRLPTMYYNETSGVGIALRRIGLEEGAALSSASEATAVGVFDLDGALEPIGQISRRPIRVGIIGLGAGSIATYAQPGDTFRFYEINPVVKTLADDYFTYLKDCRGKVEVVIGDARRSMEDESPQAYDVLALDAFSGDAIPTHLLTREAFEIYKQHLAPGGVIAAHISNKHLDLGPVLIEVAKEFGWQAINVDTDDEGKNGSAGSQWILLTANERFLNDPVVQKAGSTLTSEISVRMWTDEYSNLLPLLD